MAGEVAVGAPSDDGITGSVYIFAQRGDTWSKQAKLVAGDQVHGALFGSSVAITEDTLAVGAPFYCNLNPTERGTVYVFARSGSYVEAAGQARREHGPYVRWVWSVDRDERGHAGGWCP